MMKQQKDPEKIKQEYYVRQSRQLVAIAVALFLVLLAAVVYKRPALFGDVSRSALFGFQAVTIATFLGFSSYNWRCPSCMHYLGADITRNRCSKCGCRLR